MEKHTEQISTKIVLCDLPNTLFDSRHRTIPELNDVHITNVQKDELNYTAYSLLQAFHKLGYTIIFTHYCLNRLRPKIEHLMQSHKLPTHNLYTNFCSQDVHSNNSLKRFLAKEHFDFDYVIDNDPNMRAFWDEQSVGLINVPLPIKYSEELR